MNWIDLMMELVRTCPDSFGFTHVEANPVYKRIGGEDVRVSVDFDTMIFEFTGKYKDKMKARVRLWSDSRVTASIELKNKVFFDYPVTNEDEHFEQRVKLYGSPVIKDDPIAISELKEIYDWTFNAYNNLLK